MKLYTVDLRDIDLNSDWQRFMSKARMDKINKYKQEKSRLASIGAEIALIKAVRDNIPDAEIPVSWEYLRNGKPRLLKYPKFFYNISHSGDYAICAVSDSEVGVDIQKIRKPDMRIAKRYFTEDEYHYICKDEKRNFFKIWTRKESILKASGFGITIPLNSVSVIEDTAVLDGKKYSLTEIAPPEIGYVLCICEEITDSTKSE